MCASAQTAQRRSPKSRASFLELIDKDPSVVIYGVTTAMGERASHRLTRRSAICTRASNRFRPRPRSATICPIGWCAASSSPASPTSSKGHAATSPRIAQAVAEMLDGAPMPAVPARRSGRCGRDLGALSAVCGALDPLRARSEGARLAHQRLALRRGARGRRGDRRRAAGCSSRSRPSPYRSRHSARRSSTMTRRSRRCGAIAMRARCCAPCAAIWVTAADGATIKPR